MSIFKRLKGVFWILLGIGAVYFFFTTAFPSLSLPQYSSSLGCYIPLAILSFGLFALLPIVVGTIEVFEEGNETAQDVQAQATWDRLYYCFRDDIVYIPGPSSQYCPRPQMRSLLYQEPLRQ